MNWRSLFAISSSFLAVVVLAPMSAYGENVGSAAAVRPSSTGTPPGAGTHTLQVGTKIVSNERIRTSQSGSLQVMFNDKSTLTVGPNSDMVVDKFVYNPNARSGQFGVNLARGTLRFVGGQISHTAGATITTPAATLGIRGGAILVKHGKNECDQRNRNSPINPNVECTTMVCLSGKCTATSRRTGARIQLAINEAVQMATAAIGPETFGVQSVTVNQAIKTGDPNITTSQTNKNTVETFNTEAIDNTVDTQSPAPDAPSPPTPGPGIPPQIE